MQGSGSGSGPAASPQPMNSVQAAGPAASPLHSSLLTLRLRQTRRPCGTAENPGPKGGGVEEMPPPLPDSRTQRMAVKEGRSPLSTGYPALESMRKGRRKGQMLAWGSLLPTSLMDMHRPHCSLPWPRPQRCPFSHFLFFQSPGSGPRSRAAARGERLRDIRDFCVSPQSPSPSP